MCANCHPSSPPNLNEKTQARLLTLLSEGISHLLERPALPSPDTYIIEVKNFIPSWH